MLLAMACLRIADIIVLLALVHVVLGSIANNTKHNVENQQKLLETRRKPQKSRSTSSSSGDKKEGSSDESDQSLGVSSDSTSSDESSRERVDKPKSSLERKGWRKWHRKCTPCPGDMQKKWRDPSINWICGGYQRARRSFKSACMMRYRNCQDGTMFVSIHRGRCANDTGSDQNRHGDHFFYDYVAVLSDDRTDSIDSRTSSSQETS